MKHFLKILCSTITIYLLIIFGGGYLTLKYEKENSAANIKTYSDAYWWALNASSIRRCKRQSNHA